MPPNMPAFPVPRTEACRCNQCILCSPIYNSISEMIQQKVQRTAVPTHPGTRTMKRERLAQIFIAAPSRGSWTGSRMPRSDASGVQYGT